MKKMKNTLHLSKIILLILVGYLGFSQEAKGIEDTTKENQNKKSKVIIMNDKGIFFIDDTSKLILSDEGIIFTDSSAKVVMGKEGIIIQSKKGEEITILGPKKSFQEDTKETKQQENYDEDKKNKKSKANIDWDHTLRFEFGINNFLYNGSIGLPQVYDSVLHPMPSAFHNSIYYITKVKFSDNFAIKTGVGVDMNRMSFNSNYGWGKDSSKVYVRKFGDRVTQNRFKAVYLNVPLMFNFKFLKYFSIDVGGFCGMLMSSKHKLKLVELNSNETKEVKQKIAGNYNLSIFRYGVKADIFIGEDIGIYFNYDISPYFKPSATTNNFNQFSAGVVVEF